MTKDKKNKSKKEGGAWAKFLKPRAPIRGVTNDVAAGGQFIKDFFQPNNQQNILCPTCENSFLEQSRNQEQIPVWNCSDADCHVSITIDEFRELATKSIENRKPELILKFKNNSRTFFYVGSGIVIAAVLWAVVWSSKITLLAAIILAIPIFLNSVIMDYRAWQISNNKIFMRQSQFLEYLKTSLNSKS